MSDDEARRVDYDTVAPVYDVRYARHAYEGVKYTLRAFMGDASRVLEVGCGTGHWLEVLGDPARELAGLDASDEMLAKARARALDAELVHGRAEALPWADASFDRVVCINALHHFDDARRFLAEARRVLRAGGGVLCVGLDPHTGLDRWWIYDAFAGSLDRDRARHSSTVALRAWMSEAGLVRPTTTLAEHLPSRISVHEAIAAGYLERTFTSQLTLLTDEEYARGRARLEGDPDAMLTADLRLWATAAWI
jgi:ubiquinone/menaquinone biosynthesis C-methylase UbiE